MQQLIQQPVRGGYLATIAHSTKLDGDLSPSTVEPWVLASRRQAAIPHPWQAVHQVHGDRVVSICDAAIVDQRPFADALTTDAADLVIAVHSGDCVPVGFISDAGIVGVAHAGWKGLEAGVLESTVRRLRSQAPAAGNSNITATVGPHIRASQYEFGEPELVRLASRFGDQVISSTSEGRPALDLTAGVAAELARLDVSVEASAAGCTAQDTGLYWSHRARQEAGRIALVAWLEVAP